MLHIKHYTELTFSIAIVFCDLKTYSALEVNNQ